MRCVLPRNVAIFKAFENAMTLDIAMGGSTNTVLHLLAAAHEGEVDFTMADIDRLSRRVPVLCKVAPASRKRPYRRRAPRRRHHGHPRRTRPRRPDPSATADASMRAPWATRWTAGTSPAPTARRSELLPAPRPGGVPTQTAFSQSRRYEELDLDRENGVIREAEHAFSKDGGLAVLNGNLADDGCIVKTAGVDESHPGVHRPGQGLREPGRRREGHPQRQGQGRRRGGDPLRRTAWRPGHAGNALSDELPEIEGPRQSLRAGHRWPLLGRHIRPIDRPCARRKRQRAG